MDLICEFHECLKIKTSIKTRGKDIWEFQIQTVQSFSSELYLISFLFFSA